MTDQEYVVQAFARHFTKYRDKRIILYGAGPNTKGIVEQFGDFSILGLLDRNRTGQERYGKPVLSLEEAAALQPDLIVTVARWESCRAIFFRLEAFCREKEIPLFSINGRDLFELFGSGRAPLPVENPLAGMTEKVLQEKLAACDSVSFAVQDTLLAEKTWNHEDFRYLLQQEGRTSGLAGLLQPRKRMMELLHWCRHQGKKVSLVLPEGWTAVQLQDVLEGVGLGEYDAIPADMPAMPAKHLHIGSNAQQNAVFARRGAAVFAVLSVQQLLRLSAYRGLGSYLHTLNDRSLAGCFMADMFNDPFSLQDGRRTVREAYEIGRLFLGGLSTAAVLWFIERVQRGGYDGILFGARDGYLMQKLYRQAVSLLKVQGLPPDYYFQVSRLLCWKASLGSDEDILRIWRELTAPAPELVLHRIFGIAEARIRTYSVRRFGTEEKYLLSYKDQLLQAGQRVRQNYQRYWSSYGFHSGQRYAFFDFVSRGACQHWLGKLLPCRLEGLYVCQHHRYDDLEAEQESIRGYYEERHRYMPETYLYAHYGDAEFIYTSPEPSIYSMDEAGRPVYYEESRSATELRYVAEAQQGIQDFLENYVGGVYLPAGGTVSPELADKLYSFVSLDYTDEECRAKDLLMRDDGLCMGRRFWSVDPQSTRR